MISWVRIGGSFDDLAAFRFSRNLPPSLAISISVDVGRHRLQILFIKLMHFTLDDLSETLPLD
jgi:hypothetical protein